MLVNINVHKLLIFIEHETGYLHKKLCLWQV